MNACAIVVAAGTSRRMGFDKLAAELDGRPVLLRSLDALEQCKDIDGLVVVTGGERRADIEAAGYSKMRAIVEGGEERHQSVANGLAAVPEDCEIVAVHDAARPLVREEEIRACLAAARDHGVFVLAYRIDEMIERAGESGLVTESLDRANLWAMETPQAFRANLLR